MPEVYDKTKIAFWKEDTEDNEKIYLKIYLRRARDREWFEADVALDKKYIKPIKGLSQWQKEKYMMKGKDET